LAYEGDNRRPKRPVKRWIGDGLAPGETVADPRGARAARRQEKLDARERLFDYPAPSKAILPQARPAALSGASVMSHGPLTSKLAKRGRRLLIAGAVTTLVGVGALVRFVLRDVLSLDLRTGDQLGRAAALPHILTVLGLGFLIFGLVLVRTAKALYDERGI
jgi:hypothetical protein